MSYCTVEEAWGPNFGRTNVSLQPPPPVTPNLSHAQNAQNTQNAQNVREHFASGNAGYNRGETNGYEDEHGHYSTVDYKKTEHTGPSWAQRRHETRVPYARDERHGEPTAFYPLDEDAGKDHILNYSYDYDEEPQLRNAPKAAAGTGCSSVFNHLLACKDCRMKLVKTIESAEQSMSATSGTEVGETGDLDITELALLVAAGVFFIFLLDALIKFVKRFK